MRATTVVRCGAAIDAIVFAPDGTPITASRDGPVRAHGSTPKELLVGDADRPFHVLGAGPELVVGNTFGELVWRTWAFDEVRRVQAMEEGISCIAVRDDGFVAVGGDDCTLKLFDPDGTCAWVGETYKWPYAADFSPDGQTLIVATWDAYLYPVDVVARTPGTAEQPCRLPYPSHPWHDMPIFDVRFLSDGRVVTASLGENAESVRIYALGEKETRAAISANAIHALALSPDATLIAGGGNDQTLYVWNASDLTERSRLVLGTQTLEPERLLDRWYPAYAEFHEASGPHAVFSLAFDPAGTLWVGTQSGELLQVEL